MRWRLLWASLVAAWAPLGARGGQGGEAKDDLVVVPCCGLGNRVTVLMEAMAMGVAWGLTPVLSWAAGSVLGARACPEAADRFGAGFSASTWFLAPGRLKMRAGRLCGEILRTKTMSAS